MLQRVSRSFGAQLLGLVLTLLDRFLVVGLLIRTWGVEIYGDWALLLGAAGLLSLAEAGLNVYFGNAWQRAGALGVPARFNRILSVAITIAFALALVLASLTAFLALRLDLAARLSLETTGDREAAIIFALLAAAASSQATRGCISQIYRGRGNFTRGLLVALMLPLTLSGVSVAAVLAGVTPLVMAWIYLSCDLIAGWGVLLFDLRRRYPELAFRPAIPCLSELKDLGAQLRWLAIPQVAPIAWLQAPVVTLGLLSLSGSALVSFLVQRQLINLARQVGSMLSNSVGVELAGEFHAGSKGAIQGWLLALGTLLAGAAGSTGAALMLLGEPFVSIWTANPQLFDRTLMGWLLLGGIAAVIATPLSSTLMLTQNARVLAIATAFQLAAGLPAMAILAWSHGAHGAAAGLAFGEVLACILVLPALSAQVLGIDALRYVSRCVAATIVAAAISGGVACALMSVLGTATVPEFLVTALLWSIFGFFPSLAMSVPRPQRQRLVKIGRSEGMRALRRLAG